MQKDVGGTKCWLGREQMKRLLFPGEASLGGYGKDGVTDPVMAVSPANFTLTRSSMVSGDIKNCERLGWALWTRFGSPCERKAQAVFQQEPEESWSQAEAEGGERWRRQPRPRERKLEGE
jgi:hypothetical protein